MSNLRETGQDSTHGGTSSEPIRSNLRASSAAWYRASLCLCVVMRHAMSKIIHGKHKRIPPESITRTVIHCNHYTCLQCLVQRQYFSWSSSGPGDVTEVIKLVFYNVYIETQFVEGVCAFRYCTIFRGHACFVHFIQRRAKVCEHSTSA